MEQVLKGRFVRPQRTLPFFTPEFNSDILTSFMDSRGHDIQEDYLVTLIYWYFSKL